jgi:hypothetical protein
MNPLIRKKDWLIRVFFVRLKFFAKWFVSMLGEDAKDLCWHEKFQQGLLAKVVKKT